MLLFGLEERGEILPGVTHFKNAVRKSAAEQLGVTVTRARLYDQFLFTHPTLEGIELKRIWATTFKLLALSSLAKQIAAQRQAVQEDISQKIPDEAHLLFYEPGAVLPTHKDTQEGKATRIQIVQLLGESSYSVYDPTTRDKIHTVEPVLAGDILDTDGSFPHSAKNIAPSDRVMMSFIAD